MVSERDRRDPESHHHPFVLQERSSSGFSLSEALYRSLDKKLYRTIVAVEEKEDN